MYAIGIMVQSAAVSTIPAMPGTVWLPSGERRSSGRPESADSCVSRGGIERSSGIGLRHNGRGTEPQHVAPRRFDPPTVKRCRADNTLRLLQDGIQVTPGYDHLPSPNNNILTGVGLAKLR